MEVLCSIIGNKHEALNEMNHLKGNFKVLTWNQEESI